jgi:hypothetical protein
MQLEETVAPPEAARAGLGGRRSPIRLTHEELSAVLDGAIARQSHSTRAQGPLSTLDDAVEVAAQLDIPREHVLAALGELQQRKLRQARRAAMRRRRTAAAARFVGPVLGLPFAWLFSAMTTMGDPPAGMVITVYLIGHALVHGALWWRSLGEEDEVD